MHGRARPDNGRKSPGVDPPGAAATIAGSAQGDPMPDDKDRLGSTLKKKGKADESQFFAERDKEIIERLRKELTPAEQSAIKEFAHSRCPRCVKPLVQEDHLGVTVDRCPDGHGLWLDDGELEAIAGRERDSWLGRLFRRR